MKLSFLRTHVEVCRESKQLYEEAVRYAYMSVHYYYFVLVTFTIG